ncbi:unnamed protein product [Parnassius mnemosyne]
MKQVKEKKLIAGKWVVVTRNVETNVTIGDNTENNDVKRNVDDRTASQIKSMTSETSQRGNASDTSSYVLHSQQRSNYNNKDDQSLHLISNKTHMMKKGQEEQLINQNTRHSSSDSHIVRQQRGDSAQRIISSEHESYQSLASSNNRSQENIHTKHKIHGSTMNQNLSRSNQHLSTSSKVYKHSEGEHVQKTSSSDQSLTSQFSTNQHHLNSQQRIISDNTGVNMDRTGHTNSIHQSSQLSRNQLSDSVTKTSREFQQAMHGGSDVITSTTDNVARSGYHKRTSDLTSDSQSANAVLHRKGITSTNEAHHSISSTAASQRKSIGNLNERGEYISNSTHSTDRKSISSMHRSARDNTVVISQHTDNADFRRTQRRDGQSTMVVEREPRVNVRDNLRVGGEFFGQSEARSYGSFSRSEQSQKAESTEHVERVQRVTRHGNSSQFILGDAGNTSYKREFTTHVHGTCPATTLQSPSTQFKHTRDSREHKFYSSKITH